MTTTIWLLNLGILAFVLLTGLGTRALTRRRFTLPLAVVAVAGILYLQSVPTSTGDIELIAVLGAAGVLLGVVAGALMQVRPGEDGSLVTHAGASYAAVWAAVVAGRLLFAYGADHWFALQIAHFSQSLDINGSAAYTSAFVIMALAMVTARVAVTAFRAVRVGERIPSLQRQGPIGLRRHHSHLHRYTP